MLKSELSLKLKFLLYLLSGLSILTLFINQAPHNLSVALLLAASIAIAALSSTYYVSTLKLHKLFYAAALLYFFTYTSINALHFGLDEDFLYALKRVRWVLFTLVFCPLLPNLISEKKSDLNFFFKTFLYILILITSLIIYDSLTRVLSQGPSTSLWFTRKIDRAFHFRSSWTYNPIPFSKIAVFASAIFALGAAYLSNRKLRTLCFIYSAAMGAVAVLSFTRATWLGLICISPLIFIRLRNIKLISTAGLIAFVLASAFFFNPSLNNRLRSISDTKNFSNLYRIEHFKANLKAIADKPLLGIGYAANRKQAIMKPYMNEFHENLNRVYRHPHNEFLDIAAGTGVLNFALFLFILIYPIYQKINKIQFSALPPIDFIPVLFLCYIYITAFFDKLTLTSWTMIITCWAILLIPRSKRPQTV